MSIPFDQVGLTGEEKATRYHHGVEIQKMIRRRDGSRTYKHMYCICANAKPCNDYQAQTTPGTYCPIMLMTHSTRHRQYSRTVHIYIYGVQPINLHTAAAAKSLRLNFPLLPLPPFSSSPLSAFHCAFQKLQNVEDD